MIDKFRKFAWFIFTNQILNQIQLDNGHELISIFLTSYFKEKIKHCNRSYNLTNLINLLTK